MDNPFQPPETEADDVALRSRKWTSNVGIILASTAPTLVFLVVLSLNPRTFLEGDAKHWVVISLLACLTWSAYVTCRSRFYVKLLASLAVVTAWFCCGAVETSPLMLPVWYVAMNATIVFAVHLTCVGILGFLIGACLPKQN
ncbi:MAG TPA: hypothetical protein PLY87_14495 [Planctomycetaceae bacterium]|nr:hypothetical protein [Planctomycetaceae bacterium]HQZ66294.1 hypothetical protein [Planctomycetaceae bacterium]